MQPGTVESNSTATKATAVTPSDTVDLASAARALFVGVQGDVKVDMLDVGEGIVFVGVQGILPIAVKRVYNTGTTATSIVALF